MASYRVFTCDRDNVVEGATLERITLKGAGVQIVAVTVGAEGRGRERGLVVVDKVITAPCPHRNAAFWQYNCGKCGVDCSTGGDGIFHPDRGEVSLPLMFAEESKTQSGKVKFLNKPMASSDEYALIVARTFNGFRGSNSHTGDRIGWKCGGYSCDGEGPEMIPPTGCPKCGAECKFEFAPFPGVVLARGRIAQGAAGNAGSGEQLIFKIAKNTVWRTSYGGRMYGKPGGHYYRFDGTKVQVVTWEERIATDVF